jgi:hypothetical protein
MRHSPSQDNYPPVRIISKCKEGRTRAFEKTKDGSANKKGRGDLRIRALLFYDGKRERK